MHRATSFWLSASLLVLSLMIPSGLYAAETEAIFNGANGKLILPYLRLGSEVYYVELELIDEANLLFKVSLSSIANVTPTDDGNVPDQSVIVGSWGGNGFTLALAADKTYTFVTVSDDDGCPLGTESGTYQWEPSTGVFVATIMSDANGECGFSHEQGIQRFIADGNELHYSQNNISETLISGGDGSSSSDGGAAYTLTITKDGNGTGHISSSTQPPINCGDTCSSVFTSNTTVSLTATPDSGSYLFDWGGCPAVSGAGNVICNVIMNSNKTINVKFVSTLLSVSASGTGSGKVISSTPGINCGAGGTSCAYSFPVNTTVSLTATPDAGSSFQGWSGSCTSIQGPNNSICMIDIVAGQSSILTVNAGFRKHLLTASNAGTGSGNVVSSPAGINCGVFGSVCTYSFSVGTTVSIQALAANGSTFAGWSGSCTSITGLDGSICNVLVGANESDNLTVAASYTKNP